MGAVYNGYMFNGGLSARLQEITDFTWSWSYTAGAQWITADLSNYEWVVLSFIPSGTTASYRIRHYWAIPINGDDVGVSWRFSESPSSSTTYSYAACAHVYATTAGIYLRSISYDKTVYLQPGSVQLFSVSCGNKVSPVHIPYGCELPIYDGLATNGYGISLPYTINSDYDVYIDFTVNSYQDTCSVLGNTANNGYDYLHLTMFNNRWYCNIGGGEVNWTGTFSGRHTFQYNHNGKVYYDGVEKATANPTTANYNILLGKRGDLSTIFNGIIHEFKITSISSGEVICDYVPFTLPGIPMGALYDITSNSYLFTSGSMSGSVVKTIQITELPTCGSM